MTDCEHHPNHPTVLVDDTPIDELLAPLIRLLWAIGIDTMECCQHDTTLSCECGDDEHPEIALGHVSFYDLDNTTRFVKLIANSCPHYHEELGYLSDDLSPSGFRVFVWYQEHDGNFMSSVVITLPTDRLTEIAEAVRSYLSGVTREEKVTP